MHGAYTFNATLVTTPGTCVVVHKKTAVCGRWEIRDIDGWYLVHALHYYKCFEFFENNKDPSRISDIVEIFLHHFNMPFPLSTDKSIVSAKQLAHALQNTDPSAPLSQLVDPTMASIRQLSVVLRIKTDAIHAAVTSTAI